MTQISKVGLGLLDVSAQLVPEQPPTRTHGFLLLYWLHGAPSSHHPATPSQHQGTDRPGGDSRGHWGSVVGKGLWARLSL